MTKTPSSYWFPDFIKDFNFASYPLIYHIQLVPKFFFYLMLLFSPVPSLIYYLVIYVITQNLIAIPTISTTLMKPSLNPKTKFNQLINIHPIKGEL